MLRIQKSKIQKYLLPKSLWYYITCLIGPITINMSKYISSDGKNPDKKFSSVRYILGRIHLVLNKTLTEDTSIKQTQIKLFLFNPILLKLGEVVVSMCTTTSPSFNKIGLNTKKFLFVPV